MKKIIVLLAVCLSCLVSCGQLNNQAGSPPSYLNENKNAVSEKEHTEKDVFWLQMYGKKDTFTSEISNTLFFTSFIKEKNMIPMFIIEKTIKKSGEVSFIICATINSDEYKAVSSDKEIKIKLADNSIMEFDCGKKLQKTPSGIYQTLFLARITIEEINRLRKQNKNTTVRISSYAEHLDFTLPPLFFEYLREI